MLHSKDSDLSKALDLRESVKELGLAYGQPPRLWRFPPYWYFLWEDQWQEVKKFGSLLPLLLREIDGWQGTPTYIRADFTPDRQGRLMIAELNATPVWDFATQAIRGVYHSILGLSEKYYDPFPGSARVIGETLKKLFGNRRVVILLSPDRVYYKAEYTALSMYFRSLGISAVVSETVRDLQVEDVVYRTFTEEALMRFPELSKLIELQDKFLVAIWPAFSNLEYKLWMAYLFDTSSARNTVSGFSNGLVRDVVPFVPWTWPVDPSRGVVFGGTKFTWSSNILMGDLTNVHAKKSAQPNAHNWVLKRSRGAQGKGTTFSSWVARDEWRESLLRALLSCNGSGPVFVLQTEIETQQQKVTFVEPEGCELVESSGFRTRLCVSYLVENDTGVPIDSDATMRAHPLVHGSSDAVSMPVVVRTRK